MYINPTLGSDGLWPLSHQGEIWGHPFQLGVVEGAVSLANWCQDKTLVKVKRGKLSLYKTMITFILA